MIEIPYVYAHPEEVGRLHAGVHEFEPGSISRCDVDGTFRLRLSLDHDVECFVREGRLWMDTGATEKHPTHGFRKGYLALTYPDRPAVPVPGAMVPGPSARLVEGLDDDLPARIDALRMVEAVAARLVLFEGRVFTSSYDPMICRPTRSASYETGIRLADVHGVWREGSCTRRIQSDPRRDPGRPRPPFVHLVDAMADPEVAGLVDLKPEALAEVPRRLLDGYVPQAPEADIVLHDVLCDAVRKIRAASLVDKPATSASRRIHDSGERLLARYEDLAEDVPYALEAASVVDAVLSLADEPSAFGVSLSDRRSEHSLRTLPDDFRVWWSSRGADLASRPVPSPDRDDDVDLSSFRM